MVELPENQGDRSFALAGRQVCFASAEGQILTNIDCSLEKGRITALLGPNGSGKSTLMRLLMRLEKPTGGTITLYGEDISSIRTKQFARQVAFLPQDMRVPPNLSVRDLVACGRHPHRALWQRRTPADDAAVADAIGFTNLTGLADRQVGALSGGERQRALIAMALAQQTSILMLDEPTTYLDLRYQIQILELIHKLNKERGLTVCWILHDLNEAVAFSDAVIVLSEGKRVAHGKPADVMTPELVQQVFGVNVRRVSHPDDDCPVLLPARLGVSHQPMSGL